MIHNDFKAHSLFPPDLVETFRNSKLIINTTPMGMFPEVDDSATTIQDSFMKGQIVFDVVYNPVKTKLLRLAEIQGATIITGLKMFVEQGARSFELWTGQQMEKEKVYRAIESYLVS
jgi:shikimate dehydrogenase